MKDCTLPIPTKTQGLVPSCKLTGNKYFSFSLAKDFALSLVTDLLETVLQRSVFSCYPFGLLFILLLLLFWSIVSPIVLPRFNTFFITLTLLVASLQSWRVPPLLHLLNNPLVTMLKLHQKMKPSRSSRKKVK